MVRDARVGSTALSSAAIAHEWYSALDVVRRSNVVIPDDEMAIFLERLRSLDARAYELAQDTIGAWLPMDLFDPRRQQV